MEIFRLDPSGEQEASFYILFIGSLKVRAKVGAVLNFHASSYTRKMSYTNSDSDQKLNEDTK